MVLHPLFVKAAQFLSFLLNCFSSCFEQEVEKELNKTALTHLEKRPKATSSKGPAPIAAEPVVVEGVDVKTVNPISKKNSGVSRSSLKRDRAGLEVTT